MGYGNGYSSRSDHGSRRYNNSQVAHIWAQGDPAKSGQSGNGNFYFNGRDLWSYGNHFLVGRIMADGTALLNADSYSVSTAGHQSDARGAVSHRDTFYIGKLTDLHDILRALDQRAAGQVSGAEWANWKKRIRRALVEHATRLQHCRNGGRYGEQSGEEAGAYLARLAALPAQTWEKAKRERERLDAKRAKQDARAKAKRERETALKFAQMSDSEWRAYMAKDSSKYERFYADTAKALYHAVRLAKAEDWSAKRRAILKARRADALRRKAGYRGLEANWYRWHNVKSAIDTVRAARDILATVPPLPAPTRQSAVANLRSRLAQLSLCEAFPLETQLRLAAQGEALSVIGENMAPEVEAYREAERERRRLEQEERDRLASLKREEQIAAWHAGADVRIHFDAESGGAAIRIVGDNLETSHGASVPLAHAIKAFRFVKLVRQRGVDWQRNGKTIRVGHFQIDRIAANGDFVAGCHKFTWPEIERAAALAGVADMAPDDSAVIPSM